MTDHHYAKLDDQIAPADLSTESAVDAWFRALGARGIEFHPEETFAELIDSGTGKPTFRLEDAEQLDRRMRLAYEVCDPCAVALRIVMKGEREALPQWPVPSRETPPNPPEVKITEQGSKVDVVMIRGFLKRALGDDAVADVVNDLLLSTSSPVASTPPSWPRASPATSARS